MDKNIYEMLNDMNIDIDNYKKEEFNDFEKKKLKSKFRKSIKPQRKNRKGIAVAAAVVIVVGSIGLFGTDAGAEIMAKMSESISESIGIHKDLESYNTVVNKCITDNGITIQLNEVILDKSQNQLIISDTISSTNVLKENDSYDTNKTIYINNRKVKFTSGSGQSWKSGDYSYQSVYEYDLSSLKDMDLSGDLDIKIEYSKVMVNYKNPKRGKWVFEFKANGDALKIDTKEINLNNSFVLENGEKVILEKYTSNALGQNIFCKIENYNKNESYDVMLKGTDDLGNKVEFYLKRGSNDSMVLRYSNIDRNLEENAKELTLTPYAVKFPEQSGKMSNDFKQAGEEFNISLE